jgi:hypothetical protein
MRAVWILPLLLAVGLAQTREGNYWVQMTSGTIPVASSGRLRVSSQGAIEARGTAGGEINYSLKKRVRAQTEAEARRLLSEFRVRAERKGDWTWLVVTHPERGAASSELKLQAPRGLRHSVLETRAGAVSAYDLDGRVEVETGGGQVRLDQIASNVTVRTGGGGVRFGRIGGSLRCLSGGGPIHADHVGGEAFLESAGGEIVVVEAGGPVVTSNAGGNIRVERAASNVTARTIEGLIDILWAGGLVRAETGAGSVKVAAATRGAQVETSAGTIQLRGVSGPLRVSTASGSILAELMSGNLLEDSVLNAGSGDITVSIPSNFAVTLQVHRQSATGGIVSEFPALRLAGKGVLEGALNGGGPLLKISTAGGKVYLRRQE